MERVKIVLITILLSIQYIITLLFKSDIPMNIDNEDIIYSLIILSFIQLIVMFINKNYSMLKRILIFAFIIWLIDTIHLIIFNGYKDYRLNLIGIYTVISNLLYCIYKLKRNN